MLDVIFLELGKVIGFFTVWAISTYVGDDVFAGRWYGHPAEQRPLASRFSKPGALA